jgi:hypothetical protein
MQMALDNMQDLWWWNLAKPNTTLDNPPSIAEYAVSNSICIEWLNPSSAGQ